MSTIHERISSSDGREILRLSQFEVPESPSPHLRHGAEYDVRFEYVDSDGVKIQKVDFFDVSYESPDKEAIRSRIAGYVERVGAHPEWSKPFVGLGQQGERVLICNNPVSEEMYSEMPAMAEWRRELVPQAIALYPLQYPEERYLPNGFEIDDLTRSMFVNSLDAVGIRNRARVMSKLSGEYINGSDVTNWTSLACGAAVPVLNAIQENIDDMSGINLRLVDFDPSALSFAKDLALSRGLVEGGDFDLMNRNLLKDLILTEGLVQELGEESMEMVDALGIFEYFDENRSTQFLSSAYKLVKPGGAFIAANMLDTHPEFPFNQRVIGWPTIYPRSVESIKRIIRQAGLSLENVSMTIPSDGIYAVFEIKK